MKYRFMVIKMTAEITRSQPRKNKFKKIDWGREISKKIQNQAVQCDWRILDSFSVFSRPHYSFLNFCFLGWLLNTINLYFWNKIFGSPPWLGNFSHQCALGSQSLFNLVLPKYKDKSYTVKSRSVQTTLILRKIKDK